MTTHILWKALAGVVGACLIILASSISALAAPIGSGMVTIPIPTSSPGLSINLVTGDTSTTTDTPDGWDVQISGQLIFSANTSRPAREAGLVSRVNRRVAGTYNLPPGFEVGPDLPYLNGQQPTDVSDRPNLDQQYNWSFPGDANYVGVKFWNEDTGAYHYGWMRFCVSGNASIEPRALVEYAYESTPDTPILVGAGGDGSPSDCGSGGLTEIVAPYCIDSADISSTTIRSLVLEATASCNTLRFIQTEVNRPPNVDYLPPIQPGGRDDQTPWENTTMQGPAGKPVNIKFEGFNIITGESQGYQIKIRTLTLKDVNLETGIFEVKFAGSPTDPTTAITLENAAIDWIRGDVDWQWNSGEPMTFTVGGGDNQLRGMIGVVPPTTTLTVANGSTLSCDQCGSTELNRPDTDRLFFSNAGNQVDVDGGTLEIRDSYVIFGSGTSQVRVHDGGRLFVVGGDTVLRTGGNLTVDSGGIVELGLGGVMLDTGEDSVSLDDASIVVRSTGRLLANGMFVNGSSTVSFGPDGAEVNADTVIVADGQTLTLDGAKGNSSSRSGTLSTRLLFTESGSLVRFNGESVLAIEPGPSQVWDNGSIEMEPDTTLVIRSGAIVTTQIPIDVDGFMRVEGVWLPGFDLAGDGTLQIISGGSLRKTNLKQVSIDPKIDMDFLSNLDMRIDPTAGQSARLIANTAFNNNGAFLVLNVTNDKELAPGTQFTIIEYPDGNGAGELFRRPGESGNRLEDGDLITSGLNTYRINYNPASITLTVVVGDKDKDGILDDVDNCPLTPNPKQKDMDFDGIGNQCDPDTDGDGFPNEVDEVNFPGKPADPDDDNDGVLDVDENDGADAPFNSLDPDRDDDGIVDGLDRAPDDPSNAFTECVSPDATLAMSVLNTMTCAASNSITTLGPIGISGEDDADGPGDLLMISRKVEFTPGFLVEANGRLSVVSADPAAQIPNPEVPCNIYTSTDVPKLISETGTPTVTSELDVSDSFTITDVNVLNLNGKHSYFSDLDFNLTSPNATDVQLMERSCNDLNRYEDFGLNLDDEAVPGDWPCPPVGSGTYQPTQVLSTFDGENSNGTWTLTVNDNVSADGGSLDGWSLRICFDPQP